MNKSQPVLHIIMMKVNEITDEESGITNKVFDKVHAFFGNPGFDEVVGV